MKDELERRLEGGFGATADLGRAPGTEENDGAAWSEPHLIRALRGLDDAQSGQGGVFRSDARQELFDCFDAHPHVVRALLHRPSGLLENIPRNGPPSQEAHLQEARAWRVFTGTIEHLWEYLRAHGHGGPHRVLEHLAARTRFLALSEPFRHPGHRFWLDRPSGRSDLEMLYGEDSKVTLIRNAREARDVWRAELNGFQARPLFDQAPPFAAEEEVRALAFASGFGDGPLVLAEPRSPGDGGAEKRAGRRSVPVPPYDRTVMEEVVEYHLLPRFATGKAWAVAWSSARGRSTWAPALWIAAATAAGAAFAAAGVAPLVGGAGYVPALVLAALVYGLTGWGVLVYGRMWAMPLMLRIPAAAAVGLIVLVALHPDWWTGIGWGWGTRGAIGLLIVASFGYLLIAARNHNSGQVPGQAPGGDLREETREQKRARRREEGAVAMRLVGRALVVTGTGLAHSFLVALLGMVLVAPVFSEDGAALRDLWKGGGVSLAAAADPGPGEAGDGDGREPGRPWAILTAATAWCLAAGVFSQILWDDKPITAPLSHRRWRVER